ncbi:peptidase M48 Ste24p [Rahnella aceris]|jgi:Zn-dependent protease with chaperone function|uniref:Peptidase M48 Ste24p n=1 Tax=Rahnella sp. (strain Y9602) TaxID=2703885 RepID=A0A0H3FEJ6_RAHSY|nr:MULTISPECIES: M48 family metallopeptidase [Rahnella]AFE60156.1 peptidase M48 Ste24p [Rahnella aquatilis HX2]MDP9703056.1 Zn-dependent protease with chaperone function [Rahnella aquatilis]ADW75466.1 peptidase M48 Ste24p [Rahnella aceris]MBU9858957.1 M48 family metallopeptidase [Rahnella aceris]MCM2446177.1 M48 family metallopeptidase [Rahnella sp. CG8]
MIIEGFYQPPGRAARKAARLFLGGDPCLTLEAENLNPTFSLSEIEVSDALGTIPLFLTFPDGGRFVPADDGAFRHWLRQHRRPGWVYRMESHKRGVLLTLLATCLLIFFYIYGLLPWASNVIAQRIPTTVEQNLGRHTLTLLSASDFRDSALPADKQKALQQLFQQVIPPSLRTDRTPVRLKLMNIPDVANAFMLTDGTLILSDKLVALSPGDDALAGVMLHEMGHHAYRHPMRMLVRSSLVSLTLLWMTGDVSGIGDTLLQTASLANELQFSRGMEREADNWAIAEMKREGRSLEQMAEIYSRVSAESQKEKADGVLPDWLSTHPAMQSRIGHIRDAAKE